MQWRQRSGDRIVNNDNGGNFLRSSWMAQADDIATRRLDLPAQMQRPAGVAVDVPKAAVQPDGALVAKKQQVLQQAEAALHFSPT